MLKWCSNFRLCNEEKKELRVALPTVEENLDTLAGAKIFSSLESANAYFSIKAQDSSLRFLNFLANGKIYRYTQLPFGLKNSAACFTLMINKIIQNMPQEDFTSSL